MKKSQHKKADAIQRFEPKMESIYPIETVVNITQTPRHQIAVYCRYGLVSTVSSPELDGWWFDHDAIRVLRRIQYLRDDYDMNLASLRIISDLFNEVERLRDEVRMLRRS